ncbi:Cha4p NDAI_0B02520 [Naumovozyma dairenensis CBS 421]|uniref:Zn(2)-C6 fungal-type domain-containing protein n=1 Tax=Naumovozyma dairenensis (strain ATCC 10597 / BCRC 20456 / CBS 421 / NBRC 0211 / NRRL Y-12639) TaxID=1071378 RepID=G0W676_NAUDC|nr:hypothetical protein NDAI_0B02520 [Naumovozyma dairenensis CBS 421]CCD23287.1 hypothetical protein NDAI_0B02520 [Naumovozyma dairenensis CBS 421]
MTNINSAGDLLPKDVQINNGKVTKAKGKTNNDTKNATKSQRKIACQHCRKIRRKCDMINPCSNCIKFDTTCVYAEKDMRTTRYSNSYVKALECHIALLESSLKKIKSSSDDQEKTKILDSLPLDNIIGESSVEYSMRRSSSVSLSSPDSSISNDDSEPTASKTSSIYPSNSLSISKAKSYNDHRSQLQLTLSNLSQDPLILRSFSLFFKWLYPGHFMFIHRETFLSAFFGDNNTKDYYCSEELIYAIAALGSKISNSKTDSKLFSNSFSYYQHSKKIVLEKIFHLQRNNNLDSSTSSSKLAIIQTLLCLSFYDIGNGENPMAWYLSGLAFRIAHEIGLHLNPKAWTHVYEDELTMLDIKVRSRIYWGCYIADHLISILFGRSTTLRLSNSTIPETDELPNIENGLEDYIYDQNAVSTTSNPLKKLIVLSRITEVFAGKIFVQSESFRQKSEFLNRFNKEMKNWRKTLPLDLRWSLSNLKEMKQFNPSTTYIWLHYYIVLISYNKPFIDEIRESRELIEQYIEELHYILEIWLMNFKTLEKCNIYIVYLTLLSIQCMVNSKLIENKYYTQFLNFLKDPTLNHDLAKKFIENLSVNDANTTSKSGSDGIISSSNNDSVGYERESSTLPLTQINHNAMNGHSATNVGMQYNMAFSNNHMSNEPIVEPIDLLGSLSYGTDFSLEYNFDFTLLNEIDTLIGGPMDKDNSVSGNIA